jgi:hypothetical protein
MRLSLIPHSRKLLNGMVRMKITCWDGRKFIGDYYIPDIEINKDHWDKKTQRLSYLNDNEQQNKSASTLNSYFDKVNDRIRYAKDKQAVKEYTIKQAFDYACGKSKIESVDGYINTVMSKYITNDATLRAYKGALGSFKRYTEFKNKEVPWVAFNYNTLDAFRIEYTKKWRKSSSNSVLKNLRAVLSNAQKRGYVSKDLEISNDLNFDLPPKKINTATTEEIIAGIEKCKTIRDYQAVALWVLMFATRGMYLADVVKFKEMNVEDAEEFLTWMGDLVLRHRRSKTENTSNADMLINISGWVKSFLILPLKKSFVYTHYQDDPSIIGDPNDRLSIFGYKPNANYSKHVSFWRYYQKKIKSLTGYTFKEARKTFNTQAKALKVTQDIRKILLGQKGDPLLSGHYDNDDIPVIKKQVDEAHEATLEAFDLDKIMDALYTKLKDIVKTDNLPIWIFYGIEIKQLQKGKKYFTSDKWHAEENNNDKVLYDFGEYTNYFKNLEQKQLLGEDEFIKKERHRNQALKLRVHLDFKGMSWMPPPIEKIFNSKKYQTNAKAAVELENWVLLDDEQREIIRDKYEKSKNKGIKKV